MQILIDHTQKNATGEVNLVCYKGSIQVVGRASSQSFDENIATFEDDGGSYNQYDAEGFIRLNALRLKTLGRNRKD